MDSPHKGPSNAKMFSFYDVIMISFDRTFRIFIFRPAKLPHALELGRYQVDAGSVGPIPARFWHIMAWLTSGAKVASYYRWPVRCFYNSADSDMISINTLSCASTGRYQPDVNSIGPTPALFWHTMACRAIQGYDQNIVTSSLIGWAHTQNDPWQWEPLYCATPPWWRLQMETFSALLTICAGNSPVPGEFSAQRPVTRSFDVFFDLRLNQRLSKQSLGWWFETPSWSLWRQCNANLWKYLRKWWVYTAGARRSSKALYEVIPAGYTQPWRI